MLTNLAKSRYGLASARVVFTLPSTGLDPKPIGIQQWHGLPVDERAPVRSVAMVDVVGDRFLALVVDTASEDVLLIDSTGSKDTLRAFADEIMPEFRNGAASSVASS